MGGIEQIKAQVLKYCDKHNHILFTKAITIYLRRKESSFNVIRHVSRNDKSGETDGCGCIYCRTLVRYVASRKCLHKLENAYTSDRPIGPLTIHKNLLHRIDDQKEYCKKLRSELVQLGEELDIPNAVKRKKSA